MADHTNIAGDYEESIQRLSRHLGTNAVRRGVFNVIYGRGSKPKSIFQIMDAASFKLPKKQQVTNALNHLSKHNLILKSENKGVVNDGSRYVYSKIEVVRANKKEILKFADDRVAAANLPTKRSNRNSPTKPEPTISRKQLRRRSPVKILYTYSNASGDGLLNLDEEIARLQREIRATLFRENIKIEKSPNLTAESLLADLNFHQPQVLHFSGHGNSSGIATSVSGGVLAGSHFLSFDSFVRALDSFDSPPKVVVLNSCSSAGVLNSNLLDIVDVAVVMTSSVGDMAASAFAVNFYAALASGQSVLSSFKQGRFATEVVAIDERLTPELHAADGVDVSKMKLT
ncbi:CHAT domain-containing protein [Novosphingopyxis iocasae]|uniref:CHAT domain-containing protein n=1 Tax=Novosphingopyxis iocasae TaxID=2762729 RepID=UPI00165158BC|nr:CHAT domain-containing protein [Novosphingopyxis iocasae]